MANKQQEELQIKLLLDVFKDVGVIKETQARIETNVAVHIKRTHLLEAKVGTLERYFWMLNGATAILTVAAGLLRYLKVI